MTFDVLQQESAPNPFDGHTPISDSCHTTTPLLHNPDKDDFILILSINAGKFPSLRARCGTQLQYQRALTSRSGNSQVEVPSQHACQCWCRASHMVHLWATPIWALHLGRLAHEQSHPSIYPFINSMHPTPNALRYPSFHPCNHHYINAIILLPMHPSIQASTHICTHQFIPQCIYAPILLTHQLFHSPFIAFTPHPNHSPINPAILPTYPSYHSMHLYIHPCTHHHQSTHANPWIFPSTPLANHTSKPVSTQHLNYLWMWNPEATQIMNPTPC